LEQNGDRRKEGRVDELIIIGRGAITIRE